MWDSCGGMVMQYFLGHSSEIIGLCFLLFRSCMIKTEAPRIVIFLKLNHVRLF